MTAKEIQDKINAFANLKANIISYEKRIQFLSVANPFFVMHENTADYYVTDWKNKLNNKESFERFITNFSNPNKGTSLIEEIWTENSKVFNANDKRISYVISRESDQDINLMKFWKGEGWTMYQNSPNSFGMVSEQKIMSIYFKHVLFYSDNDESEVSEFCYQSNNVGYYFAENQYYIFDFDKNEVKNVKQVSPFFEGLPPVFHISDRKIAPESQMRTNVLSNNYNNIADYTYSTVLSLMNKSFAYANIIERIRNSDMCQYADAQSGVRCESGYLHFIENGHFVYNHKNAKTTCPNCNQQIAIGGIVDIPHSARMSTSSDPTTAIRFVTPDVSALEYTKKDLEETRKNIFGQCTGKDKNTDTNKNFNSELSIIYATESQKDVLNSIKKDIIECVRQSAIFIGKSVYGSSYQSVFVDLGENYMLYTVDELLAKYALAKENGLEGVLKLEDQIVEVQSAGIESEKRKAKVILALNTIFNSDTARKMIAIYELEKMPIAAMNKGVNFIIKDIINHKSTLLKLEQNETNEDKS